MATDETSMVALLSLHGELEPDKLMSALEPLLDAALASARGREALVAILKSHESRHGTTEVHRLASQRAAEHLALFHPFAHDTEITAVAMSPSGRWFATGSSFSIDAPDYDDAYERGGIVCIWDVRSGRCVNVLRVSGGVGLVAEERNFALAWHESETCLGVSTGSHGVARIDPFAPQESAVQSISGEATPHASFDGSAPAWCWIPGTFDIAMAHYIVTMGEDRARLRKEIEGEDRDYCDFRSRVCAYDGVITDGQFTLRADTLERTEARPLREARGVGGLLDFDVRDGVVRFTSKSGKQIELEARARMPGWDEGAFLTACASPEGQVAVLSESGQVTVYSSDGQLVGELSAPWARGVCFGVDGVLVLLAPSRVSFHHIGRPSALGDFVQLNELAQHPLGDDEAARNQAFHYDPAFAMGDSWVVALSSGDVTAPPEVHARLADVLAFALDYRHAWPLRWTNGTKILSLSTSIADLPLPKKLAAKLRKDAPKKKGGRAKKPSFEVHPATTEEVIDHVGGRFREALPSLDQGQNMMLSALFGEAEAAAGRAEQVCLIFEQALAPDDEQYRKGGCAISAAYAASLLAQGGATQRAGVLRLSTLCRSIPAMAFFQPIERAAMLTHLARAHDRLGEAELSDELITEALALAPSWSAEPVQYAPLLEQGDEAAGMAKLLLAKGRLTEAFDILRNLRGSGCGDLLVEAARRGDKENLLRLSATWREPGYDHEQAAQALVEHQHYGLFDEFFGPLNERLHPSNFSKYRLAVSRRTKEAIEARTSEAIDALHGEIQGLLDAVDSSMLPSFATPRLVAVGAAVEALLDAELPELAGTVADRLAAACAKAPEDCFKPGRYGVEAWAAVAAIDRIGRDVSAHLVCAVTADAKLSAVARMLPSSSGARAQLLALADSIDLSSLTKDLARWASMAGSALAQVGESDRSAALFAAAVEAAGKDDTALGEVASLQVEADDLTGAWATIQRVSKSKRPIAVGFFLNGVAQKGLDALALSVIRELPSNQLQNAIMAGRALAKVPFYRN